MPERVTKDDAIFLNGSNDVNEMQVAIASIADGHVDFERYAKWVAPRISKIPRLGQVLRFFPFDLRYPLWVDVPDFDPSDHIQHVELPAPGNEQQLKDLLTERFHQRLDLTKPLWKLLVVTGLEGGRSVMSFYVHHCICDGAAAIEIFKTLFDEPEGGWPDHVHLKRAEATVTRKPPVPIRMIKGLLSRESRTKLGHIRRYLKAPGPWFPFTQPVSGRVNFSWREFPMHRLQEIRKSMGGTITDVGLAAIGGAVDRYAAREGIEVTDKFLKVILPENVRPADRYGQMGNNISAIPALVPLGIANHAERLAKVTAYTRMTKEQRLGRFIYGVLSGMMEFIRPIGSKGLTKLMASPKWIRFARRFVKTPREHTILTSVQMPPSLVYKMDGIEVSNMFALVPCAMSLGIMCAMISYRDNLQVSLSGDAESMPNIDSLMEDFAQVLEEMHQAATQSNTDADQPLEAAIGK